MRSSGAEKHLELRFGLHDKQLEAFESPAQFQLYGGQAGGGKSHYLRIAAITACLEIPKLQTYLFRRECGELVKNHMEGATSFPELLDPLVKAKKCRIKEMEVEFTETRSKISLCHCQYEKDVRKYHGPEINFLILEEATQFTEFQIRYLLGRVRMPDAVQVPKHLRMKYPRVLATSNPGGPGHDYFKTNFIDASKRLATPENPHPIWRMSDEEGGWLAQFVPAALRDNPSLNERQYRAALMGLKRKELVEALLEGNWDVRLGAFFPELDERRHVIPSVYLPAHWFRFRTFDWGSAAPFAVLWWAVSDGTLPGIPRGALVCYREWYGASPMDRTRGLGLSNEQLARGILERTPATELIRGTVTDSKPFQANGGKTIAQDFEAFGVPLIMGDVSPGSRVQGWQQLRSRLIGSGVGTIAELSEMREPMIFFTANCADTWRTLKNLQTDKHDLEDCDSSGEDHAPDAVSLACKAYPVVHEKKEEKTTKIVERPRTYGEMIEGHLRRKQYEYDAR